MTWEFQNAITFTLELANLLLQTNIQMTKLIYEGIKGILCV